VWQRNPGGISSHLHIRYILHCDRPGPCGRSRPTQHLHFGIIRVQLWLRFEFLRFRVRLVWVLSVLDRLRYAGRIPFRVLDLLLCLLVGRSPDVYEVEEGCGGIEGLRGLPGPLLARLGSQDAPYILSNFVRLDNALCPIQGLLCELLDVGLAGRIVDDGVLGCVFSLGLRRGRLADSCQWCGSQRLRTCSSLSINAV
jgi:hypothetical protein